MYRKLQIYHYGAVLLQTINLKQFHLIQTIYCKINIGISLLHTRCLVASLQVFTQSMFSLLSCSALYFDSLFLQIEQILQ